VANRNALKGHAILERMPVSIHYLGAHLVFSTLDRRPLMSDENRPRIHAYMSTILHNLECRSITVGGTADHIHILFNMTKKLPSMKVIEIVKKDSSKFVKTLPQASAEFHWQAGYGLFGVCQTHFEAVRHYVEKQEEHHRAISFQDEFRALLKEHGIEADERYMWQ